MLRVVGPSGDWIVRRPDGSSVLDIRILLQTDDAENIYATCRGISYPTQFTFPYRFKANEKPFVVTAIDTDGAFIYIKSEAQELPALYEVARRDEHDVLIAFDAPGAGSGRNQGTFANGINADGEVAGYLRDAFGGTHGFVRGDDGAVVAFDPPGAVQTAAGIINDRGDVEGNYHDAAFVTHGFVRDHEGNVITFDAPDTGTAPGQGTIPTSINNQGRVSGVFYDAASVAHGFVRDEDRQNRDDRQN